jgi:hypothetical protein
VQLGSRQHEQQALAHRPRDAASRAEQLRRSEVAELVLHDPSI